MKKALYWILSCTWGIVMTLVGAIISLVLICIGKKPKKFGWDIYFAVGKNWGGLELGPFFLVDEDEDFETLCHEHGHGFQNIIMGPFFPLVVGLRSGARYWLREMKTWWSKVTYCAILALIVFTIVGTVIFCGIYFCIIPILIVSAILFAYFGWFFMWLVFIELPNYKEQPFPKYDDFWVEGQATEWGTKFIKYHTNF